MGIHVLTANMSTAEGVFLRAILPAIPSSAMASARVDGSPTIFPTCDITPSCSCVMHYIYVLVCVYVYIYAIETDTHPS